MIEVCNQDLEKAFKYWYSNYKFKQHDEKIIPFLKDELKAHQLFQNEDDTSEPEDAVSWLERARTSLFLSHEIVAKKLKVSRVAYYKFEERERDGTISLNTLAKAAEAMDCELVYAIRPKNRKTFSRNIWNKLVHAAVTHPSLRSYDPKKRDLSVAAIAIKLMHAPDFKREQNWTQKLAAHTKLTRFS